MATLDSAGLDVRTQAEIQAQLETDERAEISPELDLSTSSPLGQLNRIVARAIRILEEGLAAVYASIDPDSASGDALRRLSALTGTYQEAATRTRVLADVNLSAGTYAIGALVVAPTGRPEDRLTNVEEITAPGGVVSDVVFDAEETGPIQVGEDTLEISSPLAGFNAVTGNDAGTTGRAIETEAALRARRKSEVEAPGSSSAAGIAADISRNIPEVISVSVTENDTDATVDSVPPHAIEVIVFGPESPTAEDNDEVASQILASKAAGIGTYGNITRTVPDPEGYPRTIKFSRPTLVPVFPNLVLTVNPLTYAGDEAVKQHIFDRAAEAYVPGLDASWSQVLGWAHEVTGVLRATTIDLGDGAFTDIPVSSRQVADIADPSDVTVTSNDGTP